MNICVFCNSETTERNQNVAPFIMWRCKSKTCTGRAYYHKSAQEPKVYMVMHGGNWMYTRCPDGCLAVFWEAEL